MARAMGGAFRGSDLIPRDPRLSSWATIFRPSGFRTACAESSSVWPHADGPVALFVRGCAGNTDTDSTALAHLITPQHRAANKKSGPPSPSLDPALCRTCSSSRARTAGPREDPRDRSLRSVLCASATAVHFHHWGRTVCRSWRDPCRRIAVPFRNSLRSSYA